MRVRADLRKPCDFCYTLRMTTTETIAYINEHLTTLSPQQLSVIAAVTETLADALSFDVDDFRFTPEQLTLIDQSFVDFETARTVTIEQLDAAMADVLRPSL